MHTKSVEFFSDLMHCESLEAWRKQVFELCRELGYDRAFLAFFSSRNFTSNDDLTFLQTNYPNNWVKKYTSQKLNQIDPAISHCVSSSVPLIWGASNFSSSRQKAMYKEASSHGIRSGIALPIHGPRGEMGILNFTANEASGAAFRQKARNSLPWLSYLRDIAIETSIRFMGIAQPPQKLPPVTARELECIKWCAAGKSSWDISQILHCSEAAVNFHFSNLRRKFCVKSRQQVVVKAMCCGLITP